MKFISFLPLLLLLFAGTLFSYEPVQKNSETQTLSESPDFDVIHNFSHNFSEKSEMDYQVSDKIFKIREISFLETGALNVYKLPNLRTEAKIFHATSNPCNGFRHVNYVKNKLLS